MVSTCVCGIQDLLVYIMDIGINTIPIRSFICIQLNFSFNNFFIDVTKALKTIHLNLFVDSYDINPSKAFISKVKIDLHSQ